jgi:hypothetical protein
MYSLVMGDCTEYMIAKLEGLKKYNIIRHSFNVIKLTKGLAYLPIWKAEVSRHGITPNKTEILRTVSGSFEKFQTCVSIAEQYGGNSGWDTGAVKVELEAMGVTYLLPVPKEQNLEGTQNVKDKYPAMAFLSSADKLRFGKLLEDL